MTTPAQDQAPTLPSPDFERAADMLTAYAELVKITGRYAEEHYIPEIEFIVGELRAAILADRASQAALVAEPQLPVVPEGYELIAVKGFGELHYWLDRCDAKGHLENCSDLIEPWAAFDWRAVAAPVAQPASGEVQAGFIQFEGVDDTTEVMNAKALLRGLGFTVSPGPARVDGAKLLAKSIARHAVAWSEAQAATPTEPLVEQAPQEIPGLGRMSDDDGGFITLQFIDEAAAQAFMMSHGPSVEVDSMPPMRAEQAPQVEVSTREDALSHLQHALKLADRMGGGEIAHSVQCAIRALATPSAPALAEPRELPHPGGVEISALLDSILSEYGWPSNPKNCARAGWTAAMRYVAAIPQVAGDPDGERFRALPGAVKTSKRGVMLDDTSAIEHWRAMADGIIERDAARRAGREGAETQS